MKQKMQRHNKHIIANNKRIAYSDWIPESKTIDSVLCLHGINRNKKDFEYLARYLCKKGFRVIAFDMPGRGDSQYLESPKDYNYQNYTKFTLSFIEEIELKNFIFVGTSMGGVVGIFIAQHISHLIKGMVINDIGPYTPQFALKILRKYLKKYPFFATKQEATEYLTVFFRPLNIKSEINMQHMIDCSIKKSSAGYVLDFDPKIFTEKSDAIDSDRDLWREWANIKKDLPIFTLRGKNSSVLSKETLLKMSHGRKNFDWIEYDNVGHVPSLLESHQLKDIADWMYKLRC